MAQGPRRTIDPNQRRRSTKALPVDSHGTVYLDSAPHARDRPRSEQRRPDEQPRRTSGSRAADQDVIDAEIVDETGRDDDPIRGRHQERLRDRARSFFGKRTKHRETAQELRQRTPDTYSAADVGDAMTERDHLLKLRAEVRHAGEQYMESLRKSKLFVPGFTEAKQDTKLDAMHQVYVQMMMQGCMRPLSRGLNVSSVIQVVGTMAALTLLSKDFRFQVGEYAGPIKDAIQERIDARTGFVRSWAEGEADRRNQIVDAGTRARLIKHPELANDEKFMVNREAKKVDRNAYLGRRWRRRMERMEHRERGNRHLFTPDSAAMTEVALMENAFWKMREPGADPDEIYASYRAMRARMRQQMADDGLDRAEVAQRSRMIIGERMDYEPELKLMFNGIAQGRFVKAPPHDERLAGTEHVRKVWRGEFVDQTNIQLPQEAMFTLRKPMNKTEHQVALAEAMRMPITDALTRSDLDAFDGQMLGFIVGFAARQRGFDPNTAHPQLQRPLEQTELMLASMDIDNLSPIEQQEVYSNAFADAMETVIQQHPRFEHDLVITFGDDWQQRFKAATQDPERFLYEQRLRPQSFPAGPGPSGPKADQEQPSEQASTDDPQPA